MSKTTRKVMAFLTAMTMTIGAVGVSAAYAKEADTEVTAAASTQIDGVFSKGAAYHFITGSDALVIDGSGSFTPEEYQAAVDKYSPRAVAFGMDVVPPESAENDYKWICSIFELANPYVVYYYGKSNIDKLRAEMVTYYTEKTGMTKQMVAALFHGISVSQDDITYRWEPCGCKDFIDYLTFDQAVLNREPVVEEYLLERGIDKDIAREITGCYLAGLNHRVMNYYADLKEGEDMEYGAIANPDGTEKNERTWKINLSDVLRVSRQQQQLLSKMNPEEYTDELSVLLLENNMTDNFNLMTYSTMNASRSCMARNVLCVWEEEAPTYEYPLRVVDVQPTTEPAAEPAESEPADGVFSKGAEYRFIEGADVFVIDGEGSFTEDEFYKTVTKYDPRIVVIGDNVDIPVNGNVGSEWLLNVTTLSSTFSVCTHKDSKAYKLYKGQLRDNFKNYVKTNNINLGKLVYTDIFPVFLLDGDNEKNFDNYKSFEYSDAVLEKGRNMEQYLLNNGIRNDIAREIVGFYMCGLNDRITRYIESPNSANSDGTERNKKTADYFKNSCLEAAKTEQDILNNILEGKQGDSNISKFLSDSNIADDMSLSIKFAQVSGAKNILGFRSLEYVYSNEPAESYEEEIYTSDKSTDKTKTTEPTAEKTKMSKAAQILAQITTAATLKGDADLNGAVELTDLITVAKYNLNEEAYPLKSDTAYANADMNGDKDIDNLDTSALIEDQLHR